jgi:outer membrane protein assembly factor BamB/tetratricopeptide (TPR) repeat protein
MSRSLRPFVLLFALLSTVLCGAAEAQQRPTPPAAPPSPDPGDLGGVTLVAAKSPFASHLDVARRAIDDRDWAVATTLLQKVLDLSEDQLVALTRPAPGDSTAKTLVSLRTEAERMLGAMPPPGRRFYRLEYGRRAAELLKDARFFDELDVLAEVMRRYRHTDAGAEAIERLATHWLDRGHHGLAALYFEKLLEGPRLDKLSALTVFKALLAFRHVEDRNQEDRCWILLAYKLGKAELELGKRKFKIDELRKEVDRRSKRSTSSVRPDWPMFRGDASRSARAAGTVPLLDPVWSAPATKVNTTREFLDKAATALQRKNRPVLSSFYSIAATSREGTSEIPLVISRDFWGVHARVIRHTRLDEDNVFQVGDIYWEAPSTWSVDRMLNDNRHVGVLRQWMQMYQDRNLNPDILLENSVTGSLSTDGVRVYMVDDFTVPPYLQKGPFDRPGNGGGFEQKLNDAIHHNRLQAYDLASGKLVWEIGGKTEAPKAKGLGDIFFLGPPLPLNRKLYVLAEKPDGLCLVTLDPATGKLLGSHLLGKIREGITENVWRRIHAAPLAYAEGILVCPTNAGGIFGFDLMSNQPLWAYGYREKAIPPQQSDPRFGAPPPGFIYLPDGRLVPLVSMRSSWAASGPVIHNGRVIFTAPDADTLHCLSLRDGRLLWKDKRWEEDVYVGGVLGGKVLVVGSKTCRALNLEDGRLAWVVETGMPSGLGVAAGEFYYLPLKEAARTREPGICVLDVSKGRVIVQTRSRGREVPGNLLFTGEYVLSQTPTQLTAYPQLEAALKRIDGLLAKNPDDPEGRARRAFLRLDKGDFAGAVDDLQVALKQENKLDAALARQARSRLFEALTEYLQSDFTAAEKYLKAYEQLCRGEALPGVSEGERTRRIGGYYMLLGRGRESQGKFVEAVRAYLDFADLGAGGELLSVPDDPALKVAPAVFARGRIEALLKKAPAEQRKKIEEEIDRRLKGPKGERGPAPLRGFVAVFGADTPQGREARLLLAARLTKEREFAEAEQLLLAVGRQRQDRTQAAQAVEALARLCLARGLGDDAIALYRELSRDFPRTIVRDGKTGADLFNDLQTDKRFLPFLADPFAPVHGRMKLRASEERGSFPMPGAAFELERGGDDLPFFRRHRLELRLDTSQFKLLDRTTGEERWRENFTAVPYLAQLLTVRSPQGSPRLSFENLGHLVFVQTGHLVFALDPVTRRLLWEKNLAGGRADYRQHVVGPDGRLRVTYADGRTLSLDLHGLASHDALCLPTSDGLVGVSPLDGHTLWSRSGLPPRAEFFGDGQHLFIVSVNETGVAERTRAMRIADGTTVRIPDFSALYSRRHQVFGRTLVLVEKDNKGMVTLRQYDALTGKDLWKKTFAAKSIALTSQDETLAGIVQPDGKLTLFDLATGKELITKGMWRVHLTKVERLHLFRDRRWIYVACEAPSPEVVPNTFTSNLMPGTGLRSVPVNGALYAFDAESGELHWIGYPENMTVVLNHLDELPLVVLTARYVRPYAPARQVVATGVIEKRTGKLVYNEEDRLTNWQPYHALAFDHAKNTLELTSNNLKLRLQPVPDPPKGRNR